MNPLYKKALPLAFLAGSLLLAGCVNWDYDTEGKGVSTEVTLFGDEIAVPIGSIGPVTLGSLLDKLLASDGTLSLISNFIKVDEDGMLYLEDEGELYSINVYEIEKSQGDVSSPFIWDAGSPYASPGGPALILSYIGLCVTNQTVNLSFSNPFYIDVPVSCQASVQCLDASWMYSYESDFATMEKLSGGGGAFGSFALPADINDAVSAIYLSDLKFDMPANPVTCLSNKNGNSVLSIQYKHRCGLGVGPTFALNNLEIELDDLGLEIGKYNLHSGTVTLEVENTLPIAFTLEKVEVLKPVVADDAPEGSLEVDENISVTEGLRIDGGTPDKPAMSTLKIDLGAAEGTIPDIKDVRLTLSVAAQEGLEPIAITASQGLYVKSSSARLSGGFTIPE